VLAVETAKISDLLIDRGHDDLHGRGAQLSNHATRRWCLGITVERIPSHDDLGPVLRNRRPMAVVAEMDTLGQDGCHVLMTVAAHDRSLPVLLMTGPDPALLGAVDAVEQLWELASVEKWQQLSGVGPMVDFLFRAGRKGACIQLMSV
jgi:hypothetical protein